VCVCVCVCVCGVSSGSVEAGPAVAGYNIREANSAVHWRDCVKFGGVSVVSRWFNSIYPAPGLTCYRLKPNLHYRSNCSCGFAVFWRFFTAILLSCWTLSIGRYCTLADLGHGRRHLRSSSYRSSLAVPRTRTTLGDRSFAVEGPRVWNSLPATIRQITSYGQFRQHLKTHLFRA